MSFANVPLQFVLVELRAVGALRQQDVPEYFQQRAKAIAEDVNVTRAPPPPLSLDQENANAVAASIRALSPRIVAVHPLRQASLCFL